MGHENRHACAEHSSQARQKPWSPARSTEWSCGNRPRWEAVFSLKAPCHHVSAELSPTPPARCQPHITQTHGLCYRYLSMSSAERLPNTSPVLGSHKHICIAAHGVVTCTPPPCPYYLVTSPGSPSPEPVSLHTPCTCLPRKSLKQVGCIIDTCEDSRNMSLKVVVTQLQAQRARRCSQSSCITKGIIPRGDRFPAVPTVKAGTSF